MSELLTMTTLVLSLTTLTLTGKSRNWILFVHCSLKCILTQDENEANLTQIFPKVNFTYIKLTRKFWKQCVSALANFILREFAAIPTSQQRQLSKGELIFKLEKDNKLLDKQFCREHYSLLLLGIFP